MKKALCAFGMVIAFALFSVTSPGYAKDNKKTKHFSFTGVGADCQSVVNDDCYDGSEVFAYALDISIAGHKVVGSLTIYSPEDELRGTYPLMEGRQRNNRLSFTVIDEEDVIYTFSLVWLSDNQLEGGVVEFGPEGCTGFGLSALTKVQFSLVQ